MSPRWASLASTAVVTPPAVSVKMPVVCASSLIPSRISSSVTESIDAAGCGAPGRARTGPSAGLPIASDLAIVSGFTGRQKSCPAANAVATGEQPVGLGAVEHRQLALEQAELDPLRRSRGRSW